MTLTPIRFGGLVACSALALVASSASAAVNIIPDHTVSVSVTNVAGVLRSSEWAWGGWSASDDNAPLDGVLAPEHQQWNSGSFWWDESAAVNPLGKVVFTVALDAAYTLDRFVFQADNNDRYRLQWWDGAAWLNAWDIAPDRTSKGLTTRDSGVMDAITTDRLRFWAVAGDGYYGVSELQAFASVTPAFAAAAVPEPRTWAMLLTGCALAGAAMRRRRSSVAAA